MKTGNTRRHRRGPHNHQLASMEPGHEDREYVVRGEGRLDELHASMEPGHEDREYTQAARADAIRIHEPQWSPVMKTGNTSHGTSTPAEPARLNGAH